MRFIRIIVAGALLVAGHALGAEATGRQTISSADSLPVTAKDVDGTTVARSVKTRLENLVTHGSGFVNVKDSPFNAKGDGVTDDRAAIQAAIDAAPAGTVLFFPNGTYLINGFHPSGIQTNVIQIWKSHITFAGNGPGSIIKFADGLYTNKAAVFFSQYDNANPALFSNFEDVHFRDLTIDFNGYNNLTGPTYQGPRVGLQLASTSHTSVRRVVFKNMGIKMAIVVGWPGRVNTDALVEGCTFIDPNTNDTTNTGDTRSQDHSTIYLNASQSKVVGNTFIGSSVGTTNVQGHIFATAAELHGGGSFFVGNTISRYRQAVYIVSAENNPAEGFTVSGNTATGMNRGFATFWAEPGQTVKGITITGNAVTLDPSDANVLWDTSATWIANSQVGNVEDVTIAGNTVSTTAGIYTTKAAIRTYTSLANWTIANNDFRGFDQGISLFESGTTATLSRISLNGNRWRDCGNGGAAGTDVLLYMSTTNISDVSIEHERIWNSNPIARPILLSATGTATTYAISDNVMMNFTSSTRDVTYLSVQPTTVKDLQTQISATLSPVVSKASTLTVNSTTPSVANGGKVWVCLNSNPTAITDFTGGVDGQELLIRLDANTTITHNASKIRLRNGTSLAGRTTNDLIAFYRLQSIWFEAGRNSEPSLLVNRMSADRGDTSQTLTVGVDSPEQRWDTALTANRTITLSSTGAVNGDSFTVVRTGLGAFTLDVGGLKTIPAGTAAWVKVTFNAGATWKLSGYGTL